MKTMRTPFGLGLGLVVAIAFPIACDVETIDHEQDSGAAPREADYPEALAHAYCSALFACGPVDACVGPLGSGVTSPYGSEASCIAAQRERLREAQGYAQSNGLRYDRACVEEMISDYAEVGCVGPSTALRDNHGRSLLQWECNAYHGELAVEVAGCSGVAGTSFSDCESSLSCFEDRCRTKGPAPCPCTDGEVCAEGLDFCVPVVGSGELCMEEHLTTVGVCESMMYCGGEGSQGTDSVCVRLKALGEVCAYGHECIDSACEDGRCVAQYPLLCLRDSAPPGWQD